MKSSKNNVVSLVWEKDIFDTFLEFENEWRDVLNTSRGSIDETFFKYVDRKVTDLKRDLEYVRHSKINKVM